MGTTEMQRIGELYRKSFNENECRRMNFGSLQCIQRFLVGHQGTWILGPGSVRPLKRRW